LKTVANVSAGFGVEVVGVRAGVGLGVCIYRGHPLPFQSGFLLLHQPW
jgi:hypothetical protein